MDLILEITGIPKNSDKRLTKENEKERPEGKNYRWQQGQISANQ